LTRFLAFLKFFRMTSSNLFVDKFAKHTIVRVWGIATSNAILDDVGWRAVGACHDVSCSFHKLKVLNFDETITKFRKVQFFPYHSSYQRYINTSTQCHVPQPPPHTYSTPPPTNHHPPLAVTTYFPQPPVTPVHSGESGGNEASHQHIHLRHGVKSEP
jgi:hypothetical protein